MNILVVCAGGISTSILVENMKMHADNYDTIKATSLDHLKHYIDNVDVVLAAPQISFAIEQLEMKCKEKNIPLYLQGLNKESALYDSSNNLQDKGVSLVYNSTPEYAYATLMIKVNS